MKGTAHALVVSSAMVEFGLTFNVVCETDASAGRAMATRRGVGRVRHLDARLSSCAQKAWFKFEPGLEHNEADLGTKIGFEANDIAFGNNTPSTFNGLELMGEPYVRDERLVLDLCGSSHCDPNGVVGQTVCESHWTDD